MHSEHTSPPDHSSEDDRDLVIAAIRETLPEFAQRNGVTLSDGVMDNLARWIVSAFPRGVAKCTCTGRLPQRDEEDWECACTGACMRWVRVYDGEAGKPKGMTGDADALNAAFRAVERDQVREDLRERVLRLVRENADALRRLGR